ncbi:MAG TPA: CGNR zinc finger domain-containing protein [Actinotalea sp.]|nr:CGNR zinc finger domain-containing protein [Actinotalea sp.]
MSDVNATSADARRALAGWVEQGVEPGVAPAGLELVRALLNTDDRFHGVDRLAGTGPTWLVELRDALRTQVTTGDATAVDALAARGPLLVSLAGGAARLVPASHDDASAGTGAVLALVHAAGADGGWGRLKACANPGCQWVYYDRSRNRSGRWCSMGECGDVMKARAYRGRRRAGSARESAPSGGGATASGA